MVDHSKRIMIVAGEKSGDKIAAHAVSLLNQNDSHLAWFGMGGSDMADVGVRIDVDYRDYAVMGFLDIFLRLSKLSKLKKTLSGMLLDERPDILFCVDYPGMNLALAKVAKQHGIKVVYYVSPKVWASREGRIETIRSCVNNLLCILPFETSYFASHGIDAVYTGHPLLGSIKPVANQVRSKPNTVALLAGSRGSEIKRMGPLLCRSALQLHNQAGLQFVVPVADDSQLPLLSSIFKPLIERGCVQLSSSGDIYQTVDYAIVVSGTATLELAKRRIPMVVVYRLDWISYWIVMGLLTSRYISLCNLIADEAVVPELLQRSASVDRIVSECLSTLQSPERYGEMQNKLDDIIKKVGDFNPELLCRVI
jgi:lipid-A-disaccharide synthase